MRPRVTETPLAHNTLPLALPTGTLKAIVLCLQVLVRRELESTAKDIGEKVRAGRAESEEYFELGVVMLRKKSFAQVHK